ncbi:MAG: fibronectin type III domain-containing protein [Planctomycetota bacterium]
MRTLFDFSHFLLAGSLACVLFSISACGGGSSGGGGAISYTGPQDLNAEARYSLSVRLFWSAQGLYGDFVEVERSTDQITFGLVYSAALSSLPNHAGIVEYVNQVPATEQIYYYRIRGRFSDPAAQGAEFSEYSNVATAITLAAPSGLTAQPFSDTEIDLQWVDRSSFEDGFVIGRTTAKSNAPVEAIAEVARDTMTFRDTNLTPGIAYVYLVKAFNEGGHSSSASNVFTAVIPIKPWAKSFGGAGEDRAASLSWGVDPLTYPLGSKSFFNSSYSPTEDFLLAGETSSFGAGDADLWVLKTDHSGEIQWQKTYGQSKKESVVCSIPGWAGGHILAGNTESFGAGRSDVWLMNLDSDGNIIWQKAFGSTESDQMKGMFAIVNPSVGPSYIVIGDTRSSGMGETDVWLFGLNSVGQFTWQRAIGGPDNDVAQDLAPIYNAAGVVTGYLVLGNTESAGAGGSDFLFIHLDIFGNTVAQIVYGGVNDEHAYSVCQTSDLGFLVVGETRSAGAGSADALLIKLDPNGVPLWQKTLGGTDVDKIISVLESADGGYIAAGETVSYGQGGSDAWLVKLSILGEVEWQYAYGGPGNDSGYAISEVTDGGFVVAGSSDSFSAGAHDMWAFKVNKEGIIDFMPGNGAAVTATQAIIQDTQAMILSVTSLAEKVTTATSTHTSAVVTDTLCTTSSQAQ